MGFVDDYELRGRYEVWARAALAPGDILRRSGLPTDGLYDGLAFDEAALRRAKRVDWVDYCCLSERAEALAGGSARWDRAITESYHRVVPELSAVASALVSPKALLRMVTELLDPIAFPAVEWSYRDLGQDRVSVSMRARPGARACRTFFSGSVAALEGLPGHLGLPNARILTADVSAEHGLIEAELPPSRTVLSRTGKRSRAVYERFMASFVLGYTEDGTPLGATLGNSMPGDDVDGRLAAAAQRWALTARQGDVLALLVRGQANKEIARALECAENTVELHVTQLLKRSGSPSRTHLIAAFWSTL